MDEEQVQQLRGLKTIFSGPLLKHRVDRVLVRRTVTYLHSRIAKALLLSAAIDTAVKIFFSRHSSARESRRGRTCSRQGGPGRQPNWAVSRVNSTCITTTATAVNTTTIINFTYATAAISPLLLGGPLSSRLNLLCC